MGVRYRIAKISLSENASPHREGRQLPPTAHRHRRRTHDIRGVVSIPGEGKSQRRILQEFCELMIVLMKDNFTGHPRHLAGSWRGFGSATAELSTPKPNEQRPETTDIMSTNGNGASTPLTNSNGVLPHDSPVDTPAPFDVSLFRSYLLSLLPPVLGALPEELGSLFDDEFEERITRFAAEGGGVIYVVKAKEEVEGKPNIFPPLDRH